MKVKINDEFSTLKKVIVCYGKSVPEYSSYKAGHPEFFKFHPHKWDNKLILEQQKKFFDVLKKYNVELLFANTNEKLLWQMYTRDTGFVIKDKFFYCDRRWFEERGGEVNEIIHFFEELKEDSIIEIKKGKIEGGDVLVGEDEIFIGVSNRTDEEAISEIEKYFPVKRLFLGNDVMHLDVRMTILPRKHLLIHPESFKSEDLDYLKERYEFIEVTKEEAATLGTNVFVINEKTIVVDNAHARIKKDLEARGFKIEVVDYSEPIALSGSFRCTTLPVLREWRGRFK